MGAGRLTSLTPPRRGPWRRLPAAPRGSELRGVAGPGRPGRPSRVGYFSRRWGAVLLQSDFFFPGKPVPLHTRGVKATVGRGATYFDGNCCVRVRIGPSPKSCVLMASVTA
jgi:hypothetical protein